MTTVINMFGGPGAGKSTKAAELFAFMKNAGMSVELVTEYAKEIVWENDMSGLDDQLRIFAEQNHRQQRLLGKVGYIITDSPILLSMVYGNTTETFKTLVYETYEDYDNVNFLIQRNKSYVHSGRFQVESEAIALDDKIRKMLVHSDTPYLSYHKEDIRHVVTAILEFVA